MTNSFAYGALNQEATGSLSCHAEGCVSSKVDKLTVLRVCSYQLRNDFVEIMEMLDKRLNDKGKNWRHVFKSLTLLDYCLHAGSENCVMYFRLVPGIRSYGFYCMLKILGLNSENLYIVKTLKEFQYIDEYGKDQGANGDLSSQSVPRSCTHLIFTTVRQKAKDITNLLLDENRMSSQRKSRASMADRMNGVRPRSSTHNGDDGRNRDTDRRARSVPPGGRYVSFPRRALIWFVEAENLVFAYQRCRFRCGHRSVETISRG